MKIYYSKKETKNLGNYENVSVEISIEDFVNIEDETMGECFIRLKTFVNTKLAEEFNEAIPDIEEVKQFVLSLISRNENNRNNIKNILNTYSVSKIQDLTKKQLKEFYEKINSLL